MPGKYYLYDDNGWKKAEKEINTAVKEAAKILRKALRKNEDFGAYDTVSREAVMDEVYDLI